MATKCPFYSKDLIPRCFFIFTEVWTLEYIVYATYERIDHELAVYRVSAYA
ncbi:hypothetical protein D3C77_812800 [compost metagenome]